MPSTRPPRSSRPSPAQLQQDHAAYLDSLQRLAAGVAHEFNNLLGGLSGAAARLAQAAGEPGREHADRLNTLILKGGDLTAGLLAFARRSRLRLATVDVNACARRAAEHMQSLLGPARTLSVTPSATPLLVRADPRRLEAAIGKLLRRARDTTPAGGTLELSVAATRVTAGSVAGKRFAVPPGEYALLTVSDQGPPPAPSALEHLFEPFAQGPASGLTLAGVYGMVKQHNGYIVARPAEEHTGTAICVYLPSATARTEEQGTPTAAAPLQHSVVLCLSDPDEQHRVSHELEELAQHVQEPGRQAGSVHAALFDLQSIGHFQPATLRRRCHLPARTPLIVACRHRDLKAEHDLRRWGAASVVDFPVDAKQFVDMLGQLTLPPATTGGTRRAPHGRHTH